MRITLNYGRQGLELVLPQEWRVDVVRKPSMPVLEDPVAATELALAGPVGAPTLKEAAQGGRTACILICDITRPVPNGTILPPVIRELLEAGLRPENITVLVATGLHRPNEGRELEELIGDPWVLETVTVANHFAKKDEDHVELGRTAKGNPIKVDRRFVEADVKIVTGLVEPHFMAGYSGGRKVIVPGVCHQETITSIHTAEFFEHPNSANCVLQDNPLHLEQLEIVAKLKPVYAVNTVIDEERRMGFVNYGEIEEAHLEAVRFMERYATVDLDRRYSTVITTSAGYPLDQTYYQTVKGMVGAMDILKPGGTMFIASSCAEGMGSAEYVAAQERLIELGLDGFLADILPKSAAAIDEWQTEMQLKPMRIGTIRLFTDALSADDRALTGVPVHDTAELNAMLAEWIAETGDNRVAVVPEGPYVVPRYVRPD